MTKSRNIGRGGKRPRAGRPPKPEWLLAFDLALRSGCSRAWDHAERLRIAYHAAEDAKDAAKAAAAAAKAAKRR